MKMTDSIRRAGRSLRSAKGRTILTSLAIAVGAFTLTLSLAAGEGARRYADQLISSNIDPQSLFMAKDESFFGAGPGGGLREYDPDTTAFNGATFKALTAKDIQNVRDLPNVVSVTPTYVVQAQYVMFQGKKQRYTTDITAYDSGVKVDTAAGSVPELGAQLGVNDVVVPESFLKTLGMTNASELVGKRVTLHLQKQPKELSDKEIASLLSTKGPAGLRDAVATEAKDVTFRVSAVSAKSNTSFTASSALFISDARAQELSDYLTKGTAQYQRYVTAGVVAKDGVDPATVKTAIEKQGITAKTAKDLQNLLFTIVNILQGVVLGFGVIALIASVFGIINTQYISVLERTREIGLMKALGMRGRDVSRLFKLEAAWIGFLGGVLGSAAAYATGTALNPWITDKLSLGDGNSILVFQILPIVLLIIALIVIAMLAGWFPARKAAKLDPIEALRTE